MTVNEVDNLLPEGLVSQSFLWSEEVVSHMFNSNGVTCLYQLKDLRNQVEHLKGNQPWVCAKPNQQKEHGQ